jgi:hypothetical protein
LVEALKGLGLSSLEDFDALLAKRGHQCGPRADVSCMVDRRMAETLQRVDRETLGRLFREFLP